eukprot:857750-Pelagomonas_calceolata.AAC.4
MLLPIARCAGGGDVVCLMSFDFHRQFSIGGVGGHLANSGPEPVRSCQGFYRLAKFDNDAALLGLLCLDF